MMIKSFSLITVLSLILTACISTKWTYENVSTETKCQSKQGAYWYKNQCWREFDDNGISPGQIDSIVRAEMVEIDQGLIKVDGIEYPIRMFFFMPEDDQTMFITTYEKQDTVQSILSIGDKKALNKKKFEAKTIVFVGDIMNEESIDTNAISVGDASFKMLSEERIVVEGSYLDLRKQDTIHFNYNGSEALSGAGGSKLEVRGEEAYLSGDLGTRTYHQLKNMIANHPEVNTIVLTNISGSVNDEVNMHTGRILREAGLNTKVLADSDIASGGVDLFCAGKERIVVKGAKIGVHSWCCVNDVTAIEIPKDHPAHKYQLEYFTMALGPDLGPKFYFYTLESAPFDSIHYMSDEEIQEWNVSTQFISE